MTAGTDGVSIANLLELNTTLNQQSTRYHCEFDGDVCFASASGSRSGVRRLRVVCLRDGENSELRRQRRAAGDATHSLPHRGNDKKHQEREQLPPPAADILRMHTVSASDKASRKQQGKLSLGHGEGRLCRRLRCRRRRLRQIRQRSSTICGQL